MPQAVAWLVQSCRIMSSFQNYNNARQTSQTKRLGQPKVVLLSIWFLQLPISAVQTWPGATI